MKSRLQNILMLSFVLSAAPVLQAQDERQSEAPQPARKNEARPQKDYAPYPNPDAGYVSDHANLLSYDQEEQIEQWLWQIESRTDVEIIVVTIDALRDYPDTNQRQIEGFARGLFDTYGIGNLPKNDGVLLLVAVKDRKARIELGAGYGRERDADAERIMQDKIVARFRDERYAAGITAGVRAIALEFAGVRIGWNWPLIGAVVAIPVLALIAISLFRSGKRGWGWVCVGLIIVLLLGVLFVVRRTLEHLPSQSSGSWSSGGLGGFGGGSSGGGGATGSW